MHTFPLKHVFFKISKKEFKEKLDRYELESIGANPSKIQNITPLTITNKG